MNYGLLVHPPYSSDLATSDFFPFPQLKVALGGQRFLFRGTFEDSYFAEKIAEYYLDGIHAMDEHTSIRPKNKSSVRQSPRYGIMMTRNNSNIWKDQTRNHHCNDK